MADPKVQSPSPVEDDDELDPAAFKPRSRGGMGLTLTFTGLTLATFLLWDMRADVAYWFASGQPLDLGAPNGYRLERAADGMLATVQGLPGPVASRFRRYGQSYEIVALKGSPFLVRRAIAGEELGTGKPDQAPLTATGRLLRDTSIPEYQQAFQNMVQKGEAVPANEHLWVLLDGERPHTGWRTPAALLGLVAVLGFNVVAITRFFRAKVAGGKKS